jgi:hypothetical protein
MHQSQLWNKRRVPGHEHMSRFRHLSFVIYDGGLHGWTGAQNAANIHHACQRYITSYSMKSYLEVVHCYAAPMHADLYQHRWKRRGYVNYSVRGVDFSLRIMLFFLTG